MAHAGRWQAPVARLWLVTGGFAEWRTFARSFPRNLLEGSTASSKGSTQSGVAGQLQHLSSNDILMSHRKENASSTSC